MRASVFAKQSERLPDDPTLAGRFSVAAQRRVEGDFSAARTIERRAALCRELLSA
jgi:hypothetical protein